MEFQNNKDVKFKNDAYLLEKAEKNKPKLNYQEVAPINLVEIQADEAGFQGFKVINSEQELSKLATYHLGKKDSLTFDFGTHYVGRFSIDLNSVGSPMDAPLFLHLKFGEVAADIGVDSKSYDGWISSSWIQEEYVHIDELPYHLELPRRYSMRYVQIEVLDSSPKWKLVVNNPKIAAESAVRMEDVVPIKTGDKLLDKIDQVSLRTLHDCMQDVFEDGPKRDRRLWLGDLRLQALTNYQTFKNKALVKRCLYLFAGMTTADGLVAANVFTKPRNIPDDTFMFDYSLFFISVLYDYLMVEDDKELLADLYPVAKRQLELAKKMLTDNNVVALDDKWITFVDWSENLDKHAAAQAIMIYTAKQFKKLAEMKKNSEDVINTEKLINSLTKAALDNYYDEKEQLFVSGPMNQVNIASQAWMVLAHVLPDDRAKMVMKKALEKLFPVKGVGTPYMYHHIVAALFEVGLKEEAIAEMKNYWGKMVEYGADTFFEAFDPQRPNFSPYGSPIINSYCHAWSCTPTYFIRKYLV